ncbi:hypothetical protein TSAR_010440 [Trichomalopsis sarcophagae]|uniref:Chitin-binding type-2 domain-containing protein n=1 Tax=Trichomalopsis sarcophagae TaxID=543379 RepID=A0A232FKK9_9HYME|nr:hypothetical protein TSAR_010440 [Trichomalopsis sarcophagae]
MFVKIVFLVLLSCLSVYGSIYVVSGDCSKFEECDDFLGGCVVKSCGPGTEFDPSIGVCGWPLADRTNCGEPDIDPR